MKYEFHRYMQIISIVCICIGESIALEPDTTALRVTRIQVEGLPYILSDTVPDAANEVRTVNSEQSEMMIYPTMSMGDFTVVSVDTNTSVVVMSNGERETTFTFPQRNSPILAVTIFSLQTGEQFTRKKIGDTIFESMTIIDIQKNGIILQTADGNQIFVPRATNEEIQRVRERITSRRNIVTE